MARPFPAAARPAATGGSLDRSLVLLLAWSGVCGARLRYPSRWGSAPPDAARALEPVLRAGVGAGRAERRPASRGRRGAGRGRLLPDARAGFARRWRERRRGLHRDRRGARAHRRRAGWCIAACATSGMVAAYMEEAAAQDLRLSGGGVRRSVRAQGPRTMEGETIASAGAGRSQAASTTATG